MHTYYKWMYSPVRTQLKVFTHEPITVAKLFVNVPGGLCNRYPTGVRAIRFVLQIKSLVYHSVNIQAFLHKDCAISPQQRPLSTPPLFIVSKPHCVISDVKMAFRKQSLDE